MSGWTYKTLRFSSDQQTAEWIALPFKFETAADAALAAQAYMLAQADRGHMVAVSLEPSEELKPVTDRLIEHGWMLAVLKQEFSRNPKSGLWELIHVIDPEWPDPWKA